MPRDIGVRKPHIHRQGQWWFLYRTLEHYDGFHSTAACHYVMGMNHREQPLRFRHPDEVYDAPR